VGPVSLSSPEAGRRTHRAVDRVFIGLLHKGKRLSRNGTVTSHNGKCGHRAPVLVSRERGRHRTALGAANQRTTRSLRPLASAAAVHIS
jgi:hypothetical protein